MKVESEGSAERLPAVGGILVSPFSAFHTFFLWNACTAFQKVKNQTQAAQTSGILEVPRARVSDSDPLSPPVHSSFGPRYHQSFS